MRFEFITEGAGAIHELRIGGETPIFNPPISLMRGICFSLLPGGFYLLTTYDDAYRSTERGADQGCCRSQP
jgi:hypothetical protein